jgi:hypothetical protein
MLLPTQDNYDEILNTTKELSDTVINKYIELGNAVRGRYDKLGQVWDVMSFRERRELLLQVWPDMPIHRR